MKRATIKKMTAILTLTVSLFTFVSCGSSSASEENSKESTKQEESVSVLSDKPSYTTVTEELDKCTIEIPDTWEYYSDLSTSLYRMYIPKDADLQSGTSSINVMCTTKSSGDSISTFKKQTSIYESQLKSQYPTATDFTYNDYKVSAGDVFEINCTASQDGIGFKIKQLLVIGEDSVFAITATSLDSESLDPSPSDIVKYIAISLVEK